MNKQIRQAVYNKYGGHCAYCGNEIDIKNMQVDHVIPKRIGGMDDINNLNPACRRCNHYKRAEKLERFRTLLLTLHERIKGNYICKVAEDYGVITIKKWDGKFYFEKVGGGEEWLI
jgi:hypothetical protein